MGKSGFWFLVTRFLVGVVLNNVCSTATFHTFSSAANFVFFHNMNARKAFSHLFQFVLTMGWETLRMELTYLCEAKLNKL
jgi:hypothetical protein